MEATKVTTDTSTPALRVVTGPVLEDLTPMERRHLQMLERRIEKGLQTFREVGEALLEIRDLRLYRLTHVSFEMYARERWELDRGRVYQLMNAAEVVKALPSAADGAKVPINEAQARELVPIYHSDPSKVADVWKEVVATGKPITAPLIREVVNKHSGITITPRRGASVAAIAATPNATTGVAVVEHTRGRPAGHNAPSKAYNDIISLAEKLGQMYVDWMASKPPKYEREAVGKALDKLDALTSSGE